MECHHERRTTHQLGRSSALTSPSFSSTLLDAIYRSIDDGDDRLSASFRSDDAKPNWKLLLLHHPHHDDTTLTPSTPHDQHYLCKPRQHLRYLQQQRRDPFVLPSSTSTSTSSSDAESIILHPIRTEPPLPDPIKCRRSRLSKIYGELKKATAKAPPSPGGRLAGLISALFASAAKMRTKTKAASPAPAPPTERRVRFCPVGVVVDGDCRPCGEMRIREIGRHRRDAREREGVRDLGRGGRRVTDREDDGASSDSSSDLFELEDLTAARGEGRCDIADELPVYGTTRLGRNRAIARGVF